VEFPRLTAIAPSRGAGWARSRAGDFRTGSCGRVAVRGRRPRRA
jgi:hypothetical protein